MKSSQMYGYTIPNPPDLKGQAEFQNSPTPAEEVARYVSTVSTTASWDHHSGFLDYYHLKGTYGPLYKHVIDTVSFQWVAISSMSAEAVAQHVEVKLTTGITSTETETSSYTQSIGGEAGGGNVKLSTSLSKTFTKEISNSISESKEVTRVFDCPPNTSVQVWQLVATFNHSEDMQAFAADGSLLKDWMSLNTGGASIDTYTPPYYSGTSKLVVKTDLTISESWPESGS